MVSAGYAVLGRWRENYDDVDYAQAIDMLESVGAEHLAERTYGTLSEGERKRVLIARSLMTDPELLLLDEPAAGLDLGGREELVARLADLAADPDAPAIVLVTHHVEEIPQGFTHCMILSEGEVVDAGLLPDVLTAENLSTAFGQSIALDVIDGRYFARRTRSRAAHRRRSMTVDPLVPRPAATVMLVRDTAAGHQGVPDAAALRDGLRRRRDGVSRRRRRRPRPQCRHRLGRTRSRRGGRSASASTPTWPRRWCARRPARRSRSPACCSPAPPTIRTASSATPRCTAMPARRWSDKSLSFAEFLRTENLVLRADLLRPWANWVTPKEERTRRYDTYFFVGALPEGQRADGENTETDQAGWTTPEAALDDFAEGRTFLLPPTWTQLDSLAGHTVAEVLAVERQIVAVEPHLDADQGQSGRSSSSTATATTRRGATARRERIRHRPRQRRPARHRHAGAVAAADQRADPAGVPRDRRRAADLGRRDDIAAVIVFGGHEIFSAGDDVPELRTLSPEEADAADAGVP